MIWAAEDGTLSAWRSGASAEVVFPSHGAIFKGLAIFGDALYATDFAGCAIQAFDGTFTPAANFGDGLINAYCQVNGELRPAGRLEDNGRPIRIDGLWGIGFGNGFGSGPKNVLYFAAGPDDESNGHFGKIEFESK